MECTVQEKKIIEKANFYFLEKLKAHVLIIPDGFKNGIFVSKLEDDKYFWFIPNGDATPIRLFLFEIYDIEDYKSKEETDNDKAKL